MCVCVCIKNAGIIGLGIAVSKKKGTLVEEGIFGPCQRRDHLGKE